MTSTQTGEMLAQMTGTAVEVFTLLADANQKVLRELVDLSAGAAKEGVRLYAELQSSAVEAVKDSQTLLLQRPSELPFGAPGLHAAFRLFEGNTQAMTRSAERLQVSVEQAGQEIQATFSQLSTRMQALYSAARLAAAPLLQPLLEGAQLLAERRHLVAQGVRLAGGLGGLGRRRPPSQASSPSPPAMPTRGTRDRPRAGSS